MRFVFVWMTIFWGQWALANSSFVGIQTHQFIGDPNKSLDEGSGFGLTYMATPQERHFRWTVGGQLLSSSSPVKLDGNSISSSLLSADFLPGVSFYPFLETKIRPHLSAFGILGIKYLKMSGGVEGSDKMSLSYGYQLSIGADLELTRRSVLGFYVNHINNKASKIAGKNGFDFGGIAILLGLRF